MGLKYPPFEDDADYSRPTISSSNGAPTTSATVPSASRLLSNNAAGSGSLTAPSGSMDTLRNGVGADSGSDLPQLGGASGNTATVPPVAPISMLDATSSVPQSMSAFERAFAAMEAVGHLQDTAAAAAQLERPLAMGGVGAAGTAAGSVQAAAPTPNPTSGQHVVDERPAAAAGRLAARLEASKQRVAAPDGARNDMSSEEPSALNAAELQDQRLRLLTHHLRERPISPGNLQVRPASPASSVTDTERQFLEAVDDQHAQVPDLKEENKLLERTISATLTAEVMATSAVQAAEADMRRWLAQADRSPPRSPRDRATERASAKSVERHRAVGLEKLAEEALWRHHLRSTSPGHQEPSGRSEQESESKRRPGSSFDQIGSLSLAAGMDAARAQGLVPPRVLPSKSDLSALEGSPSRIKPVIPRSLSHLRQRPTATTTTAQMAQEREETPPKIQSPRPTQDTSPPQSKFRAAEEAWRKAAGAMERAALTRGEVGQEPVVGVHRGVGTNFVWRPSVSDTRKDESREGESPGEASRGDSQIGGEIGGAEGTGLAAEWCGVCGNLYMPDSRYCRRCGLERAPERYDESALPDSTPRQGVDSVSQIKRSLQRSPDTNYVWRELDLTKPTQGESSDEEEPLSPNLAPYEPTARQGALKRVYRAFAIDGDGAVGAEEMLELGQTRRELGQKSKPWSWDQTLALLAHMGADQSGHVTEDSFVSYFNAKLPLETLPFERDIAEFLACSRRLRQRKKAERILDIQQAKDTVERERMRSRSPEGSPRQQPLPLTPEGNDRVKETARSLPTTDLTLLLNQGKRARLGEADPKPQPRESNLSATEDAHRIAIDLGKKKAMEKMGRKLAEKSPPLWSSSHMAGGEDKPIPDLSRESSPPPRRDNSPPATGRPLDEPAGVPTLERSAAALLAGEAFYDVAKGRGFQDMMMRWEPVKLGKGDRYDTLLGEDLMEASIPPRSISPRT